MTDKIKDIVSEDSRDLGAEVQSLDESSVATHYVHQQQVQQLLIPRYKVIADYPSSIFSVGRIIPLKKCGAVYRYEFAANDGIDWFSEYDFQEYPHLFRKLEWWEERTKEEMPTYLRSKKDGEFIKALEWHEMGGVIFFTSKPYKELRRTTWWNPKMFLPATEQEYNDYLLNTDKNDAECDASKDAILKYPDNQKQ